MANHVGKASVSDYTLEIGKLLSGKRAKTETIEKLEKQDARVWRILLREVTKKSNDVRFSQDLIVVLETDDRAWQFLEKYLNRLTCSLRDPHAIPLFDLSEFCGYLKFKREALHSEWGVNVRTKSTSVKCLKLLVEYLGELNKLRDEGSLTMGNFENELRLFFRTLYGIVSTRIGKSELEELTMRAKNQGLM